jgi:hypothetical protein
MVEPDPCPDDPFFKTIFDGQGNARMNIAGAE